MKPNRFFIAIALICLFSTIKAQDKPNFLWLTVEDMSPYLSSYGNEHVSTPTLDSLAASGIRYTNAYSNGSQCSPARSTLISGLYAPTLGTDVHRERRAFPGEFYWTKYLRQADYYSTNNNKKDYNANNIPNDVWDESSKKATYFNRQNDQPFFAVFNYGGTHTQRIATRDVEGRSPRIISPNDVTLPSYLPNTPIIRDDLAWHYDAVIAMDNWIAEKLAELRASGEAENTIIFFFSDHGGCLPRAKAYLYQLGVRVPLIIYIPDKWKHLVQQDIPSVSDRLVSFVDFGATVLSMAGVKKPDYMISKPFLGTHEESPRNFIYTFRTNQAWSFIPSRAITDGEYKFIWNFNTAYPNGSRQSYQWQMPSYQSWDEECMKGNCNKLQQSFWEPIKAFEFYDLRKDSLETRNLAYLPAYKKQVKKYKALILKEMKQNMDLGLYPRDMRRKESEEPFYHWVRRTNEDVEAVINAAALASTATKNDIKKLIKLLKNGNPAVRYWAAIGFAQLSKKDQLTELPKEIYMVLNDKHEHMDVRLISAEAIIYQDDKGGVALDFLMKQVEAGYRTAYAVLQNIGELAAPAKKNIIRLYGKKDTNKFYLRSALINSGAINYNLWSKLDFE